MSVAGLNTCPRCGARVLRLEIDGAERLFETTLRRGLFQVGPVVKTLPAFVEHTPAVCKPQREEMRTHG